MTAENVPVIDEDIAQMNADSDRHLWCLPEVLLQYPGAIDSISGAGENDKTSITIVLNDLAPEFADPCS